MRFGLLEVAAITLESGKIVFEDQHVEIVGTEQITLDRQGALEQHLGFVELAGIRKHEREVVHAVARALMPLAEHLFARRQHLAEDRFGLRVLLLILQHASQLVERVLGFLVRAAERLFASGEDLPLDLYRAIEVAARTFELREILQSLQRFPVRFAETADVRIVDFAETRFCIVEPRHRAIGLAEIAGRFEHGIRSRTFLFAKTRQHGFQPVRRFVVLPRRSSSRARAASTSMRRPNRLRGCGCDVGRQCE